MKKTLHTLRNLLPTILLSLFLAITVWIIAISAKDPTEERRFTNAINVELIGLKEGLLMTNPLPEAINLKLRAPSSIWKIISNDRIAAKAVIDVSNLDEGEYEIPINISIGVQPCLITNYSPLTAKVILEKHETKSFPVTVTEIGDIPTAFKGENPVVNPQTVIVSGSASLISQIDYVRAILDHANKTESISVEIPVAAMGKDGIIITKGLTYSPKEVNISQDIHLRGGYRVVVVKVATLGSAPEGYRVSKISVDPSVVTIYSTDSKLLESIPSYLSTDPIILNEFSGDTSVKIGLDLPDGVSLVGDQSVKVEIEISAIEGTKTFNDVPVYLIGLDETLQAQYSPETVDIYISGPQPILNQVKPEQLYAVLDLQGYKAGHYQLQPKVDLSSWEKLSVQSLIPASIDITITEKPNYHQAATPTIAPTPTPIQRTKAPSGN